MSQVLEVVSDVTGSVEQGVRARTYGRVRDLRVELVPGSVVLHGRVPSYYLKQLAQVAAMDVLDGQNVVNAIEVG
jgi:hypothetical protein